MTFGKDSKLKFPTHLRGVPGPGNYQHLGDLASKKQIVYKNTAKKDMNTGE